MLAAHTGGGSFKSILAAHIGGGSFMHPALHVGCAKSVWVISIILSKTMHLLAEPECCIRQSAP